MVHEWINAPLVCVWHVKRFYTTGPVLQNSAGSLADKKPWFSMLLSWNGFTMRTHVTFLELRFSIIGPGLLCQHNFEHNRSLKALSIMLA